MVGFFIIIYGGDNVNLLILTFNKEQMSLYYELLEKDNVNLNFNTDISIEEVSYNFDDAIYNLEKEILTLKQYQKNSISFAQAFTQEEIKKFIPAYYGTIRNISKQHIKISSESLTLTKKLNDAHKILANINKRYADFLPYKAALYNREGYATEIEKFDKEFIESIDKVKKHYNILLENAEKLAKICDIVNDFFEKSSKATDEPKFKNFNPNDFFWSVDAFSEQLKSL